ncbi:unnamed protein product [Notodromas monacha]|uniref:Uncharacterized protein n=1 Tax=Notodromas monacha TaxID=399045 RepID=A0A7R9GIG6_9CRUS|nr:unnamed protein product [Notodromas monacha]CAG0923832.1 unnamed protein product [Notodromas monacha]
MVTQKSGVFPLLRAGFHPQLKRGGGVKRWVEANKIDTCLFVGFDGPAGEGDALAEALDTTSHSAVVGKADIFAVNRRTAATTMTGAEDHHYCLTEGGFLHLHKHAKGEMEQPVISKGILTDAHLSPKLLHQLHSHRHNDTYRRIGHKHTLFLCAKTDNSRTTTAAEIITLSIKRNRLNNSDDILGARMSSSRHAPHLAATALAQWCRIAGRGWGISQCRIEERAASGTSASVERSRTTVAECGREPCGRGGEAGTPYSSRASAPELPVLHVATSEIHVPGSPLHHKTWTFQAAAAAARDHMSPEFQIIHPTAVRLPEMRIAPKKISQLHRLSLFLPFTQSFTLSLPLTAGGRMRPMAIDAHPPCIQRKAQGQIRHWDQQG